MIKENIAKVKERIIAASLRAKRDPATIKLIAISKGRSVEEIRQVLSAGITDIGENRVQEAAVKYKELTTNNQRLTTIKWHMVGHLQTNKAKEAVKIFDLIHSVDSLRLAQEIDKQAARIAKIQDILIEVNTSGEASKFGLKPKDLVGIMEEITKLNNVSLKGLMTVAPVVDNPEKARPYFRILRELSNNINQLTTNDQRQTTISMGMSDDFETAIEEGSNMLRIGRAIFEG